MSSLHDADARYIPAIDGLRAVAVLLVLFFHAGFSLVRGGFIGVDVFFVISGFLITSNIMRELQTSSWSFGRFYVRRAARLMPALFVVTIATLAVAFFVLSPNELKRLGRVSIYTSFSVSNIFFWLESGYFDQRSELKPLLHTWSLGVEEQFYLVWPLALWALYRWKGATACVIGLGAAGLLSLGAALLIDLRHPSAVFFLTPFRIYQFAIGGLLAMAPPLSGGRVNAFGGLVSVAGLLILAAWTSGAKGGVMTNALFPAMLAGLFINAAECRPVKAVFASPPMRWIGRRSYSIYLVHWPIMVLWPMATDFQLSALEGVVAILASIAAGALLFTLIEKPFRIKSVSTPRKAQMSLATVLTLAGVSVLAGAHFWGHDGYPRRVPKELNRIASDRSGVFATLNRKEKVGKCYLTRQFDLSDYDERLCASPEKDKLSYMVIGDSLSSGVYLALQEAYPEVYFGFFAKPGCVLRLPFAADQDPRKPYCREYYEKAFSVLQEKNFDGVVFASNWLPAQDDTLDNLARWARSAGLDPIIVAHRPRFKQRVRDIVLASTSLARAEAKSQKLLMPNLKDRADRLVSEHGGEFKVLNLYSILCPSKCEIVDEKKRLLYNDDHHLTSAGIAYVARRLRPAYPDLFTPTDEDASGNTPLAP